MQRPPARLWLVRHGQTDWNLAGRIQGQTPTELNAQGRREAETLAELFAKNPRKFAACFASDLPRAWQTAEIITAPMGIPVAQLPALRERDFGKLEGAFPAEIQTVRAAAGTAQTGDLANWTGVPGVESNEALYDRVAQALREISEKHPDQDVLVVTHGGVIARMLYKALGIPDGTPRHFPLSNGVVAVLQWHQVHFHVLSFVDLPFLAGGPLAADTALMPKAD